MRNITHKQTTLRSARARAEVRVSGTSIESINSGYVPKGDPLPVAKVAAIIAAKKTADWIPYCHNIPIERVDVAFDILDDRILVDVTVATIARTGVEMEALTAASAAALTLYDMLKMIDDEMEIGSIRLIEKKGGKSDITVGEPFSAAVLTVSDRASKHEYEDKSGPILRSGLLSRGAASVLEQVVPDDGDIIRQTVLGWIDDQVDIILVTGGTGIGPSDRTPEAIRPLLEFEMNGIGETLRRYGQDRARTPLLSRALGGTSGKSVVACIPGSPQACEDALHSLLPALLHARTMLSGGGHE